jgi:hypothetical protein
MSSQSERLRFTVLLFACVAFGALAIGAVMVDGVKATLNQSQEFYDNQTRIEQKCRMPSVYSCEQLQEAKHACGPVRAELLRRCNQSLLLKR